VRIPLEEELHFKLKQQQDMFTSTRPTSILCLRGAEQDDPDLHPVCLPGEPWDITKVGAREIAHWQQTTARSTSTADTTSLISPSPSSGSLHSQAMLNTVVSAPASHWHEYHHVRADIPGSIPHQLASPPDQVTKIPKADDTGQLAGWIEALGVDATYRPPADRPPKPVACFYILYREPAPHQYYRAIYLAQRTLQDLAGAIAAKWNIDTGMLRRIIRVLPRGLEVEIDDDVVREMREGQDIVMEVCGAARHEERVKREWEMAVDDDEEVGGGDGGGGVDGKGVVRAEGYEIRLIF
jgi:hypothetical protein